MDGSNPFITGSGVAAAPTEGRCFVWMSMKNLIPTVQFGNVELGPAGQMREVGDDPMSRHQAFDSMYQELSTILGAKSGELLLAMQSVYKQG